MSLLHASKVLFLAPSVTFLFVPQISPEPLNGFVPNSHLRRVWSLARTSLNVKVKGQGHQGQKRAVHSHHSRQRRNGTSSLQMISCSTGQHHSIAAGGGDFSGLHTVYV